MNQFDRSVRIQNALRQGFADGSAKMAQRKCYGYQIDADGSLAINDSEAEIVCWIFQLYLTGSSLGQIVDELGKRHVLSPTGKDKWNREALQKLLKNEKYVGDVLLQKTVSLGHAYQMKNNGCEARYLYQNHHPAIIDREIYEAVQKRMAERAKTSSLSLAGCF